MMMVEAFLLAVNITHYTSALLCACEAPYISDMESNTLYIMILRYFLGTYSIMCLTCLAVTEQDQVLMNNLFMKKCYY